MGDFSFDHPNLLHLLWALPVLAVVYWWGFVKRKAALEQFATANLLGVLVPAVSTARQKVKALLTLGSGAMLIVAMAGPRWGSHYEDVPAHGADIMFVLDVSNSMLAEDVKPNRLERAKLDIKDMLEVLPGDQVGLITFAGKTSRTCPLTNNYGSFRLALDAVDARSVPRGGTNIGDAVREASESFTDEVKDHKAVLVISDGGETDESYAVEAAKKSFEDKGVRVFTIGVGDMLEGGRIPVIRDGQKVYMKHQDQEVWSKLEPGILQSMAAVADGGYFSNTDFREIYQHVRAKVAPREFESARREMKYARFHWFAAVALSLLMVETWMTDRKGSAVR